MANVYVRSGASGAGTGADWTNAYTTLTAALTAKAAGDDFWVSEDHAETQASTITLTSPGTVASPCRIFCVNHAGTVPPVAADLATTATISATGVSNISGFNGHGYCYGVSFLAGSGSSTGSIAFNGNAARGWDFEACGFTLNNTSVSSVIAVGFSGAPPGREWVRWNNCVCTFGSVSQSISVRCRFIWKNTASAVAGSVPTILFSATAGLGAYRAELFGVDLSALGSGKTLFTVSGAYDFHFFLKNCKLGASVTVSTGAVAGWGSAVVTLVNCDSGATNYRFSRQTYQGTITQETTIVRTGGASDGTTPVSRKIVTTANTKPFEPLESLPIVFWNPTVGSSITVSIPVITDNVTLTDLDAWVEVEYLGSASFPISSFANDRALTLLTTPANQTTDSTSTWVTTGLTTPIKQTLDVTFTPQMAGLVQAVVKVAKASTTVYYDPLVLTGSTRQYMVGEFGYENREPAGNTWRLSP